MDTSFPAPTNHLMGAMPTPINALRMAARNIPWLLLIAITATSPTLAQAISGTVSKVHDGDTVALDTGVKIRLFGIDAPELNQKCLSAAGVCEPCGRLSKQALTGFALGKPITCERRGKSYKRVVAECTVDGVSLGPWMLSQGMAVAYRTPPAYTNAVHTKAEDEAKTVKLGIWGMTFIPPADWRHRNARLECER